MPIIDPRGQPSRASRTLLALALVAACGGSQAPAVSNQAPPKRAVPDDPLALLPVDSELVAYVDLARLRASPTWQRFEPGLVARAHPVTWARERCGIDLLALRSLSVGAKQLGESVPSAVGIARGLDRDKTLACVEGERKRAPEVAAKLTVERGVVSVKDRDGQTAIGFSDPSTAVGVVGPVAGAAELDRLLDAGGVPLRSSPAFRELLASVRTQDPAWFVLNGNAKILNAALALLNTRPRAVFGSLDLANGLTATLRARVASDADATQLATLLNGQIPGMARSMVQRLDVVADRSDVVIDVQLTDAQLETLAQLAGGWIGSGGP